ncbi:MAG: NAD(P)-dependent alcohol dehydrogenase [Planctomycetota bacterium]
MTAVVQRAYGGPEVLAVEEVATPTPAAGEVLIDVRATDVSAGDVHLLTGRPYVVRAMGFGLRRPSASVPGRSFAGVVAALGPGVTSYEVGDAVLCNDERGGGGLAEYQVARTDELLRVPAPVDFAEAATLPWAVTALQALRDRAETSMGGRVLVHGASGGVGHFAVQIARGLGMDVTATHRGAHDAWLKSLGARRTVDTSREDPLAEADAYDAILDMVCDRPLAHFRRALSPRGTYLSVGGELGDGALADWLGFPLRMVRIAAANAFRSRRMSLMASSAVPADVRAVVALAEAGTLRATVGATFPLERAADAYRSFMRGGTRGKTVVVQPGLDPRHSAEPARP